MNKKIIGTVQPGQQKGEETGLKTANLDIKLAAKLTKGLYKCQVEIANQEYRGLIYYGYNSLTKKDCLEVHILKFKKDIYGEKIKIKIGQYLREEKKFNSVKELSEQLKKDLQNI